MRSFFQTMVCWTRTIRSLILLAALLLAVCFILPDLHAFPGTSDSKEFRKTVDLRSGGRLKIETYKGTVIIRAWDREQVEIVARIEAGEGVSARYARESVDATEVEVRGDASSVSIRSNYDHVPSERRWFFGSSKVLPYIHYEIRAPRYIDLTLDDYKSDVELEGFEGEFRLETYKGRMQIMEPRGSVRVKTYKGEVVVQKLDGTIDASTYKGEIDIELSNMTDRSSLETYKGDFVIRIPKNLNFTLVSEIERRGDLDSDFPLEIGPEDRQRERWYGKSDVNGGGPELLVSTERGTIRLRYAR